MQSPWPLEEVTLVKTPAVAGVLDLPTGAEEKGRAGAGAADDSGLRRKP